MRVEQLKNNQIIVWDEFNHKYFFSYDTFIGVYKYKYLFLTHKWNYSRTTLKYLRQAFPILNNLTKKEIQEELDKPETDDTKQIFSLKR